MMIQRTGLLACIVATLLLPCLAAAEMKSPWDVRLPFKEAVVHYTVNGMEKGTETLYIKDYGRRSATYHKATTSMMGMSMVNETVEIMTPDYHYEFNITERTGTRTTNPYKLFSKAFENLSRAEKKNVIKNANELGPWMLGNFGGKVEKNAATILGYRCDKVTILGMSTYVVHGTSLPLKTEGSIMGMTMSTVATSIDKGRVDEKYFQFPAGITPVPDEQGDQMMQQMVRSVIETLKQPDGAEKLRQHPPMPDMRQLMQKGESGQSRSQDTDTLNMEDMGKMMDAIREMMGGNQAGPAN